MGPLLLFLVVFAAHPAAALMPTPDDAAHRGNLSLAWDAHDSGRFAEALGYLEEIPPDSTLAPRVAWLRAECWYDLGEYPRAAAALLAPAAAGLGDRDQFLLDIYWDHAWQATRQADYGEALRALAEARRILPERQDLVSLTDATLHRQRLAEVWQELSAGSDLVLLLPPHEVPAGEGWILAHPWAADGEWVPQVTVEEWLPTATRAAGEGDRVVWVRIPPGQLGEELRRAAVARRLVLREEDRGWSVGRGGRWIALDREEWRFRAAVEGLGARGAAGFALERAEQSIVSQAELEEWVRRHRGPLVVSSRPEGLQVRHPDSGRRFTLAPPAWAEEFHGNPDGWGAFWRDLVSELSRPARPYHCFCGRPVVLRELLMENPGSLLVVDREGGIPVVVLSLCTEHLSYVDQDMLRDWGVSPDALAERARSDARTKPWQLGFGRGELQGVSYVFLEGEGASSLARAPELLLGALEGVDGNRVRGSAVRVYAATGSTLVVAGGETQAGLPRAAAAQVLLDQARHGALPGWARLEYRSDLRLPNEPLGTFRLTLVE